MYLYELVNWLTTVVDSLVIKESYKDEAYKGALKYIADCLMVRSLGVFSSSFPSDDLSQNFLSGRDIPMMNEHALSNIVIDVDFLEDELKRIGRPHLASVFTELRLVRDISIHCRIFADKGIFLAFFLSIHPDCVHSTQQHRVGIPRPG